MADTFSFFKPPKSPLPKVEQGQLPSFVDKAFFERRFEETLKDLQDKKRHAASNDRKDELSAKIEALNLFYVQKMMEGWDGEKNEEISAEFRDFLLGKSKWNDNPRLVPWGRRKLIGEDIDAYIDSVMETKYEFDKQVNLLLNTGIIPRNLREAWIYFVYKLKNYTGKVAPDLFLKTWETFYPSPMTPQSGPQDPSKRRVLQDPEVADRLMGIREGDYPGFHDPPPPMGGIGQTPPPPPDDGQGGHGDDNGEGMDTDEEDMDTFEDPDLFPEEGEEGSQGPKGGTFFRGDYIPDEQVEKLKAQVEKSNQTVQSVVQQLQISEQGREKLSQQVADLNSTLQTRMDEIKQLSDNNKQLTMDIARVSRKHDKAYEDYQKELSKKDSEASTLKQQLIALNENNVQKSLEIANLTEQLKQAAWRHEQDKARIQHYKNLADHVPGYDQTVAQLRAEMATLRQQNADLVAQARSAQEMLDSTKKEAESYQQTIAQQEGHIRELNKRKDDDDANAAAMKAAADKEVDDLRGKLLKLREEARARLGSESDINKALRKTIEEQEATISRGNQTLQGFQEKIKAMETTEAALNDTKTRLEEKINRLEALNQQMTNDTMKNVDTAVKQHTKAFKSQKAILERQIHELTKHAAGLETQLATKNTEIEQWRQDWNKESGERNEIADHYNAAMEAMFSLIKEFDPKSLDLAEDSTPLAEWVEKLKGSIEKRMGSYKAGHEALQTEKTRLEAEAEQYKAQLTFLQQQEAQAKALLGSITTEPAKSFAEQLTEVVTFAKKSKQAEDVGFKLPKDLVGKLTSALMADAKNVRNRAELTDDPKSKAETRRVLREFDRQVKRLSKLDKVRKIEDVVAQSRMMMDVQPSSAPPAVALNNIQMQEFNEALKRGDQATLRRLASEIGFTS